MTPNKLKAHRAQGPSCPRNWFGDEVSITMYVCPSLGKWLGQRKQQWRVSFREMLGTDTLSNTDKHTKNL